MLTEYKVKGSHVIAGREWIDEKLGAGTFEKFVAGGDPAFQALLPGTWYDIFTFNDAITKSAQRLGRDVKGITEEIARINGLRDLTSLYRVFLRVAAPVRVMGFLPQLWRNYVKFGDTTVITNEHGLFVGECVGIPTKVIDWACGGWRGFVPAAIEVAGGKNLRKRIVEKTPQPNKSGYHRLLFEARYS
jgi:hypothetical protein